MNKPLTGNIRALWCELQAVAFQVIKVAELEKAGVHGNPLPSLLGELKHFASRLEEEYRPRPNPETTEGSMSTHDGWLEVTNHVATMSVEEICEDLWWDDMPEAYRAKLKQMRPNIAAQIEVHRLKEEARRLTRPPDADNPF
jgi:hypothetical protein